MDQFVVTFDATFRLSETQILVLHVHKNIAGVGKQKMCHCFGPKMSVLLRRNAYRQKVSPNRGFRDFKLLKAKEAVSSDTPDFCAFR